MMSQTKPQAQSAKGSGPGETKPRDARPSARAKGGCEGALDIGAADLSGYDMGEGTTLVPLIAGSMDFKRLDRCVRRLAKWDPGCRYSPRRSAMSILGKTHYQFCKRGVTDALREFNSFEKTIYFIEVGEAPYGRLWLLVHGGFRHLSDTLTRPEAGKYQNVREQMEDLQSLQAISEVSRRSLTEKLLQMYYRYVGKDIKLEDVAWNIYQLPTNSVCGDKALLGASMVKKDECSLFLAGMGRGSYLTWNRGSEAVIMKNQLTRIRENLDYEQWGCLLDAELQGIHCSRAPYRLRYMSVCYEPMLRPFGRESIHLKPIYNIRPADIFGEKK